MQESFRHTLLTQFTEDRDIYQIENITTKEEHLSPIHSTLLGRLCQILKLGIGERGWLWVDVGGSFPHRIWLSNVIGLTGEADLRIETEHTCYHLRKTQQE